MRIKHRHIVIFILILVAAFLFIRSRSASASPTYQTATASKGTLISTVTASGTIVAANNISVTSSANGQVAKVYIKEGDKVVKGEKLFAITLDAAGQERQSQAYASYLSAQNSMNQAKTNYYSLQAAEFAANQKFINDAVARNLATNDPTYIQENATWLAAESNFNNNQNAINAAGASLTTASMALSQASSIITSPVTGTIENITIVPGMAITNTTSASTGSSSSTIASIKTPGNPVAIINVAEIDAVKVKAGQKVTLTFDSIPDVTFTGKVAGINKLGAVSSGVTNYPATIEFDSSSDEILANMSVQGSIIVNIKDDVIKVPSSAIQSQNGEKVVRELQNGKLIFIPVTIGASSDSETEITGGINEGDEVVTSVVTPTTGSSSTGTSPFSGLNNRGGFGGGGNTRVLTR